MTQKKYPEWREDSVWVDLDQEKLSVGLKNINEVIAEIPEESREDAIFEDRESGGVRISYWRPETEVERASRLNADTTREQRERAELARLKAKYEKGAPE